MQKQTVSPYWRKKLTQEDYEEEYLQCLDIRITENGKTHSLGNYACCYVGESHGFTAKYTDMNSPEFCATCIHFAEKIWNVATGNFDIDEELIIDYVMNAYDKHFLKAHKK